MKENLSPLDYFTHSSLGKGWFCSKMIGASLGQAVQMERVKLVEREGCDNHPVPIPRS